MYTQSILFLRLGVVLHGVVLAMLCHQAKVGPVQLGHRQKLKAKDGPVQLAVKMLQLIGTEKQKQWHILLQIIGRMTLRGIFSSQGDRLTIPLNVKIFLLMNHLAE